MLRGHTDSNPNEMVPALIRPARGKLQRYYATLQLMFIGASFAMCGLIVSLLLLVYRTQCSISNRLGMYSNSTGEMEICFEGYKAQDMMPSELVNPIEGRMIVKVPFASCQDDSPCRAYPMGFCGGGPDSTVGMDRQSNSCSHAHSSCNCLSAIQPCATKYHFTISFEPHELLYRCDGHACNETLSIKVPYWPAIRMGVWQGGCHQERKSTLEDVQIWVEHECEEHNLFSPVNPKATKWREIQHELDAIPDVSFGSFWPSTISESVSRSGSAARTIFFGCMLCAAMCMLASHYTTIVKTVDLPTRSIPVIGVEFNTMRSWLPPLGLIILSAVPMVPESMMNDLPSSILTFFHLVGAQCSFVVYLVCEGIALSDHDLASRIEQHHRSEWYLRFVSCLIGSIAMLLFVTSWGTLTVFSGTNATPYLASAVASWGYSDFYKTRYNDETLLLRPAEGAWQKLKMVSYAAEFIVGTSIISNMLAIWHYNRRPPEEDQAPGSADDHPGSAP